MGPKVRGMFGGELPVEVRVAPDANHDSPVAVDLLVVYDKKLLDKLLATPSAEWFAKRDQFLKDYPKQLVVEAREWVPGQAVEPLTLTYRPGAVMVVVFADYGTAGDHRAAVDPQQLFRLVLGERDLAVEVLQ
ncbi:MAG TPA: hypothetical protein VGF69_08260 [Thermoanaerobaculia bacterium]|jgi:type VI secretion system protein